MISVPSITGQKGRSLYDAIVTLCDRYPDVAAFMLLLIIVSVLLLAFFFYKTFIRPEM